MKKNKNEIILLTIIIVFSLLSLYFFAQSKNVKTTNDISYQENGGVDYKVYLNDNDYYKEEYLDEGMQYISSIIDYILVDYKYSIKFAAKKSYNIKKNVKAKVKIFDSDNNSKVIFTKDEDVKSETVKNVDYIDLYDQIKIDYNKYNKITNDFKTKYGISADCKLYFTYDIEYESTDGEIKQNKTLSMEVPLSKQMITIGKSSDLNNVSAYKVKTARSPFNKVMLLLFIVFSTLTGVGIVVLVIEIYNRIKNESKYDRYIAKLLREYDSYITNSKNIVFDDTKNVVKVESFKELIDVRNNLDKPIVYRKINENESVFVIIDNEVYEYKVTRKELE